MPPTRLQNIISTGSQNPTGKPNKQFLDALYLEFHGRKATDKEMQRFSGRNVRDTANIVAGRVIIPSSARGGATPTPTATPSDSPFVKTKDDAAIFDTRDGRQFMGDTAEQDFFKSASDFFGRDISSFEEGIVREVGAGELPDILRNIEIEKGALEKFTEITGQNPQSKEDFETFYKLAYGDNVPTGITDPTDINQLSQGVVDAKRGVEATSRPNFALSILEDALRTKAGITEAPIGESEIFKKAGVGGSGALTQSLAARRDEIRQNHATFLNTINTMGGILRDRADVAMKNYEFALDLYDKEKDRMERTDKAIADHERHLERLALSHQLKLEEIDYANKYKLQTTEEGFEVFDLTTGTSREITRGGNRPQRNNNPGNVKAGGLADKYALKNPDGSPKTDEQGHLIFGDGKDGFAALEADLRAKIEGNSRHIGANPSIRELGGVWAEDSQTWTNNVVDYLRKNVKAPGAKNITDKIKIKTQSVLFDTLVDAIANAEGWFVGQDKPKPRTTGGDDKVRYGNRTYTSTQWTKVHGQFGNNIDLATDQQVSQAANGKDFKPRTENGIVTGFDPVGGESDQIPDIELDDLRNITFLLSTEPELYNTLRRGYLEKFGKKAAENFDEYVGKHEDYLLFQ